MGLLAMFLELFVKRPPPVVRDQALIRETSQLRIQVRAAKSRMNARRADVEDLFDAMLKEGRQ